MLDNFGFPRGSGLDYAAPILDTFVYCSRAAEGVDTVEVDRFFEWSQRRNVERDIAGRAKTASL